MLKLQSPSWPRAIIHVDMNAFFASVEQLDHPEWRERPVVVTNGQQGTCIITCSYEARAYGIKTGMRLKEAYRLCPSFVHAPSRPERYTSISQTIMKALDMKASHYFIGMRLGQWGWQGIKTKLAYFSDDGNDIYQLSKQFVKEYLPLENSVQQVQITALNPATGYLQLDFFDQEHENQQKLNVIMDEINQRFGDFTLTPASLLSRSKMSNVIPPSWRPPPQEGENED